MQALSQRSGSLQRCSSRSAKAGRKRCRPQNALITPIALTASESSEQSPCSTSGSSSANYGWPRGYLVRAAAAKGFGAGFGGKFKLPTLGGKGPKAPQGGVLPAPAIELEVPAAITSLWSSAQAEWLQYVVANPVVLPGGAEVFLVPVGADLPGDAGLIRDVVATVRPDAIALESQPQHLKSYTAMAKALEPQLTRLLAADLARSPADGRGCLGLAAREEVQLQLLAACRGASVKPDPDQLTYLFRLGSLPFAEWVVPAHLVRTASASTTASAAAASPLLLLSCGLDREARAAAPAVNPYLGREFDLYLEEVEAALGEEGGAEMDAWRAALGDKLEAAGEGRDLATLLAAWEGQCCLGPVAQRRVAERVAERLAAEAGAGGAGVTLEVVRTPADPLVAKRLVELAAGKDTVRPSRRIVAVVGRVHALSVEAELRQLAGAALA
ncbi:hypothetical protein HXX76_001408 [Chlamydomonas incerta]|uniref:Uncharacterized protein n=1 Tax=Chlamydomonas incerta TaxID=51695 RepID=A0A835WC99_CHLIN|nr:hypothetical protein HXX76_001408 [Chlamydomonas incerta]|eukprot:KAG2444664.1 hypothetical protein HXX76_001408 [Chlamydomonas incerta]